MPGLKHSTEVGPGLRRWWQEHSDLDQLVAALLEASELHRDAAASAALEELAEALEGHFSVEEDSYFPLVERLRPELAETLKNARLAHVVVRGQVDELRDLLARGQGGKARTLLHDLLDLFRRHEELEERLIADLGTGAQD